MSGPPPSDDYRDDHRRSAQARRGQITKPSVWGRVNPVVFGLLVGGGFIAAMIVTDSGDDATPKRPSQTSTVQVPRITPSIAPAPTSRPIPTVPSGRLPFPGPTRIPPPP